MRPTAGGPGALQTNVGANLSPNGRLPATLRPPIRANPSTRGFAGGRNVVERSERYASVAKPEGPKDFKARARAGMLAAVRIALQKRLRAERPEGEARTWNS
jgi:hypothetical protein